MSYEYFDMLDNESKARYLKKLETVQLKECPYRQPAEVWKNDPTDWPNIEYPDIYEYLINTPGVYSRESMKSRKGLEAYNQFISGWVGTVLLYQRSGTNISILRASVMHSQRLNEDPLQPWIGAKKDGTIICAHCNCMAGLGESCSHIGAMLFKIEAAVRLGYTTLACTDVSCKWNDDFVKKIEGTELSKIKLHKRTEVKRPQKRCFANTSDAERDDFLSSLVKLPAKEQPVGLSLFKNFCSGFIHKAPVPSRPTLPRSLRDYFCPQAISSEEMIKKTEEIYSLKISSDDRKFVELSTKLQSDSISWKEMRLGRITASVAHEVLHCKRKSPPKSLILKICRLSPPLNVPAVSWGREHEAEAITYYEGHLQSSHFNLKLEKSGLMLDDQHHFLGASADAIASCDCHGKFLIEIKCPFKHRDKQCIEECFIDKDFCIDSSMKIKKAHAYYTQIQMQMFIYKMKVNHLVIYTPNFCKGFIAEYDEDFSASIDTLIWFHKKFIGPELITRRTESEVPISEPKDGSQLFCYCQKPYKEGDKMVGCDNPNCKYQWIHFQCAKIKSQPRSKQNWFCKDCKKNKNK